MEHIVNTGVRAQHSPSFRPKPRIQSGAKRRNPAGDGNRPYARRSGVGCTPGRFLPFDFAQGRLLRLRSGQAPSTSLRAGYSAVLRTAPVGMTGKGGARHGARRLMTFHDTLHPLAAPAENSAAPGIDRSAGFRLHDALRRRKARRSAGQGNGGFLRKKGARRPACRSAAGRVAKKNALDRPVCPVGAGVERRNARQRIMTDHDGS